MEISTEERKEKRTEERKQGNVFTPPSPFGLMRRVTGDMERFFSEFGFGGLRPFFWREAELGLPTWTPDIEVYEKDNTLLVKADLPGLKKEDVKIDVTEGALTIQGERKHEVEEKKEGFYRSERHYGSFYRCIPLPEGAITERAKATFKDGVVEVAIPIPPKDVRKGRRIEIEERR